MSKVKVPKTMKEISELVDGDIENKYEFVEAKVVGYNNPHIKALCQGGIAPYTKESHNNPDHQNYNPADCVNQWGLRVKRTWVDDDGIEQNENRTYSLKGYQIVDHCWKSFDKDERKVMVPWTGPDMSQDNKGTWWAYGKDDHSGAEMVEVEA